MEVIIEVTEKDLENGEVFFATNGIQKWTHCQKNALSFAINQVLRSCYKSSIGIDDYTIFYNCEQQKQFEVVILKKNIKYEGKLPIKAIQINKNLAFYGVLKQMNRDTYLHFINRITGTFKLDIPEKFLTT